MLAQKDIEFYIYIYIYIYAYMIAKLQLQLPYRLYNAKNLL